MSDCMTFPDTVNEFMDQYKIVDTDGIYMSKGSELVPIFRMKQWFERQLSPQPDLTDEEWRLIKQLRSYHNGSYAQVLDKLIAAAERREE